MNSKSPAALRLFVSYSQADRPFLEKLGNHFATLRDNGYIVDWTDQQILPGEGWNAAITDNLELADIILLLLSPDFFSSDYIRSKERKRAFERHTSGEAIVVPILLRECLYYIDAFVATLQMLPSPANAVSSRHWHSEDEAFQNIATGLLRLIEARRARIDPSRSGHSLGPDTKALHENKSPTKLLGKIPVASAQVDTSVGLLNEAVGASVLEARLKKERPTIAIVGSGFAGTLTAIRILELATRPLDLVLFEAAEYSKHGGLAYGDSSCGWEHLLNIQAGRISLFRERPTDFLDWANTLCDTGKASWPVVWQSHKFIASSAVPRRIYGQYLAARFVDARNAAAGVVQVNEMSAPVDQIWETHSSVQIRYRKANDDQLLTCDRVVIATGHDKPTTPRCLQPLLGNTRIIDTPYSDQLASVAMTLTRDDRVLILGTGLTAYDAVLTLQRCNFCGEIKMVSRHRLTHKAYPHDHIHDILPLPLPPIPSERLSPDNMIALLDKEISKGRAFFAITQPAVDESVIEERILKALEPWIAQWMQSSDAESVKRFLDIAKSKLTTSRTGIVPQVSSTIKALSDKKGRLELLKGTVVRVSKDAESFLAEFEVDDGPPFSLQVAAIVCCIGANTDYSRSGIPLWESLIDKGTARVHHKTGRGVSVNQFGGLVRGDNSISERVFAVGPMRQGDEIERNGRLGAFVFSIGTIRNQALFAALRLLSLTESPQYSAMNRYVRRRVDGICNEIFSDPANSERIKRLVNAILAVRLSDVSVELRSGEAWVGEAVDRWLKEHLAEAINRHNRILGHDERQILQHVLWFRAHHAAAASATDIRRLAAAHARVLNHQADWRIEFLDERLSCSSLLRAAVAVFGVATGSMLLYSREDQKLFPFAMYGRIDRFTPTPVGKGVVGSLAKAFLENNSTTGLVQVTTFHDERGRPTAVFVPNYNRLGDQRKDVYANNPRSFPSVLVTLLVKDDHLLGAVYIETEDSRTFHEEDSKLLRALMSSNLDALLEAQVHWGHKASPFYRFGNFERANLRKADLRDQDLSHAIFVRADLSDADLEHATLLGTSFDSACLNSAKLQFATITGCSFAEAVLTNCVLSGADINHCFFIQSDLSGCRIAGSKISNCTFERANLSGVTLCELDISGNNFSKAVMHNCVLTKLKGVERASWTGVDLTGSRMDLPVWEALPLIVRDLHQGIVFVEKQVIDAL